MRPTLHGARAGLLGLAVLALAWTLQPTPVTVQSEEAKAPDKAAVERARETVKMLDDVHKGYVVHITDTYVKAQERTPAATVAKKVFKHVEDKGWGATRLIDLTGKPFNEANVAKSDFEKTAAQKLKADPKLSFYDEVGTKDGKPVLRAATIVPAVMKACVGCHTNVKEGQLMGAITYEVPIK